jgi:hypothetical protein
VEAVDVTQYFVASARYGERPREGAAESCVDAVVLDVAADVGKRFSPSLGQARSQAPTAGRPMPR